MDVNVVDFKAVLEFLVSGGAPIAVMYALALLAENWAGWHTLPKWLKFLLPMLLSALLAVGAEVLTGYADIVSAIAPWWKIVLVAVTAYIGSQKAYMSTKASGYGAHNATVMLDFVYGDDDESEVK